MNVFISLSDKPADMEEIRRRRELYFTRYVWNFTKHQYNNNYYLLFIQYIMKE